MFDDNRNIYNKADGLDNLLEEGNSILNQYTIQYMFQTGGDLTDYDQLARSNRQRFQGMKDKIRNLHQALLTAQKDADSGSQNPANIFAGVINQSQLDKLQGLLGEVNEILEYRLRNPVLEVPTATEKEEIERRRREDKSVKNDNLPVIPALNPQIDP